jgi:hypothetical protein
MMKEETLSDKKARETQFEGKVQWETLFGGRRRRKPSLMEGLRKKPWRKGAVESPA